MVGAPSERHSLCLPEHHFRVVDIVIHVNDNDVRLDVIDVVIIVEYGSLVRQSVLLPLWRAPAGRLQQPHRLLGIVAEEGVAKKDGPCQKADE